MSHRCSNHWCCLEVEPLEKKPLTRPKVHFASADAFGSWISRLCGRRKKGITKRPVAEGPVLSRMCLRLRADNGSKFHRVELKNVGSDEKLNVMLVSDRLAKRLAEKSLWRNIPPRNYCDDQGTQHTCRYAIKVSWRWDNESGTEDAKIYVVSNSDPNAPLRPEIDFLVPADLAAEEGGLTAFAQPIHQMPPQTQGSAADRQPAQKEAQERREEEIRKARAAKMEAARIKKEKAYADAMKAPRQGGN